MKSLTHPYSLLWYALAIAAMAAAFAMMMSRPAARSPDVLSFDMWCLEMQLYSQPRCDAHQADDVKDYEKYRASAEQYAAEKLSQGARDKDLQNLLNRDPNAKSSRDTTR